MYSKLTLGELPPDARLHELKVKVPWHILMHEDESYTEGFLVNKGDDWYISPDAPTELNRREFMIMLELCNPLQDIYVI